MITILMAAYNGEAYLPAQLDSLLAQTFSDFVIQVQDDVSTDSTWDILLDYQRRFPEKIKISRREKNSGSSKSNFLELMARTRDDYLMLCDQDDVWMPDKVEKTFAKIKSMEAQYPHEPLLVHTDLRVVDQNLQLINPSFKQATNRDYNRMSFSHVLALNNVSGCTAMYNRALAELLSPVPTYCMVHDWWLQLVGAAFGKIGHIDEPTILYRQHGKNAIGAKDVRTLSYKLGRLINNQEVREAIHSTCLQAKNFLECYGNRLSEDKKEILRRYSSIPELGKIAKWRTIYSLGAFMNGFSRNVAYFMFV